MAYLNTVPKYGFGTAFNVNNEGEGENPISEYDFVELLRRAIELGCRHFDCAPLYNTQLIVGDTIQEYRKSIRRSEFFITSKLPINMMRGDNVERSLNKTLEELQLSYLDLFLIHAPFSTKHVADDEYYPLDNEGNLLIDYDVDLLENTWKKLIDLKEKGLVRYIGLSNVNMAQFNRLNEIYRADVVQNEYHIYNSDKELFDHCEEKDVHFEAYAPFGCPPKRKSQNQENFYENRIVKQLARKHFITEPQVIIGWLHQQPLSYVVRTDNIKQLEENLKATKSVNLTINDFIYLDSLNKNQRTYSYDNHKELINHPEYPF